MLPGDSSQECERGELPSHGFFLTHIIGGPLYKLTVALMAKLLEMYESLSWLILISNPYIEGQVSEPMVFSTCA